MREFFRNDVGTAGVKTQFVFRLAELCRIQAVHPVAAVFTRPEG